MYAKNKPRIYIASNGKWVSSRVGLYRQRTLASEFCVVLERTRPEVLATTSISSLQELLRAVVANARFAYSTDSESSERAFLIWARAAYLTTKAILSRDGDLAQDKQWALDQSRNVLDIRQRILQARASA